MDEMNMEFPSDRITVGMMRKADMADSNNVSSFVAGWAREIERIMLKERRIATIASLQEPLSKNQEQLRRSLLSGIDLPQMKNDLAQSYRSVGLADGIATANQLVRQIEAAAAWSRDRQ